MTAADIITVLRQKINETDPANSHFNDTTDLLPMVNAGIRYIYQNLKSIPRKVITVALPSSGDKSVIDLSSQTGLMNVIRAAITNSDPAFEPIELSVMDYDAFTRLGMNFSLTGETDTPSHFVRMGMFDYRIWPYPNTDYDDKDLILTVKVFPDAIASGDTPDLPENLVDLIPNFMAWKCWGGLLNQYDKGLAEKKILDDAIALQIAGTEKQRITIAKPLTGNTLQAVIYGALDITGELSNPDPQYTMHEMMSLVNEGVRYIYQQMYQLPRETITTTVPTSGDIFTINLSSETRVLAVMDAFLQKTDGTGEFDKLEVLDYDTYSRLNEKFQLDTAGFLNSGTYKADPKYFVRMDMFNYRLFPQPTDNYMGNQIKLMCRTFPAELRFATETPELPGNLIDMLPHYTAYRMYEGKLAKKDLAGLELAIVDNNLARFKTASMNTRGNRISMRWGSTQAGER